MANPLYRFVLWKCMGRFKPYDMLVTSPSLHVTRTTLVTSWIQYHVKTWVPSHLSDHVKAWVKFHEGIPITTW